jgi:pimeloyl-ACP methyl ester carboxylesterase
MEQNITQQQILDQVGKSIPYQVGFNKRLAGGRDAVLLTTPPPRTVVLNSPPPPLQTAVNLDDVLTKGSLPIVRGNYSSPQQLVTVIPITNEIKQAPVATPEVVCPECPTCAIAEERENPKGYNDDQMNRTLFDILTTKPVDISCACEAFDYYSMTNPLEGEFTWKSEMEFVYRDQPKITNDNILDIMNNPNTNQWKTSNELKISYSRWSPDSNSKYANNNNPIRILLIHDMLDSKESWWCSQKLLSPFFDTISIDLIGTGDSMLPRGLNVQESNEKDAQSMPWSYNFHATYLVALAETLWPGETYYVVGANFGGQIAASMSSISEQIKGFIMINPPGFHKNNFPGIQYLDFYEMRKITSDEILSNSQISFTARVRDLLISSLKGGDCDSRNNSTLKLILKQYVNLDRKRILIDQIVAFSETPYQEFPQTNNNSTGLAVQDIKAPCLIVTGQGDVVSTPENRHLYPIVYYKSEVSTIAIPHIGHLIHIENPKIIAEIILNFIRQKEGIEKLKDAFIGFLGTTTGNEIQIISKLRNLYFT